MSSYLPIYYSDHIHNVYVRFPSLNGVSYWFSFNMYLPIAVYIAGTFLETQQTQQISFGLESNRIE